MSLYYQRSNERWWYKLMQAHPLPVSRQSCKRIHHEAGARLIHITVAFSGVLDRAVRLVMWGPKLYNVPAHMSHTHHSRARYGRNRRSPRPLRKKVVRREARCAKGAMI